MGLVDGLIDLGQNAGRHTRWAGGGAQLLQCQQGQRLQADALQSGQWLGKFRAGSAKGLVEGERCWTGGTAYLLQCQQGP